MKAPMEYPGNLYVVAAPSGTGKSSLVKALMELDSHIVPSISHTTRPPRGQEVDGREYHFVDNATFDQMVAEGAFLEWAHVHNNRYGTSRAGIEAMIGQGSDVVLEIDYQGAIQIKQLFANAVLIFILPPSWEELRSRLERRAEDSAEVIAGRMAKSRDEISHWAEYDYVLVNNDLDRAFEELVTILRAERMRRDRQPGLSEFVRGLNREFETR